MLNRIHLTQRFIIIMVLYWLTFALLAGPAIWGLRSSARDLDSVANTRIQALTDLAKLIRQNQANRTEILLAFQHAPTSPLAAIHDHPAANHLAAVDKRRAENEQLWPAIRPGFVSAEGQALYAEADAKRKAWMVRADEALAALRREDYSDAVMAAFLKAGRTEGAALFQALEAMEAYQARQATAVAATAADHSASLLTLFALLAAALGLPASWMALSLLRRIRDGFGKADELSTAIANGDLTLDVHAEGQDEITHLMTQMAAMRSRLIRLITEVRSTAESVQVAASEVAAGNMDLSTRTEQTASHLQQTTSTMGELDQAVRKNAESAGQANQMASSATEVAKKGGEVVGQVVETMQSINAASTRIADIVGVIDGIAFQTNILALNAAVEAARAGEQGRGFAVVASEVRSLAQRSAAAASEIKNLIGSNVERVERGTALVADAGESMREIVNSITKVNDIVGEITLASQEQSAGVSQVGKTISEIDGTTQQNAALVEESAAAASSLQSQAVNLVRAVSEFRVTGAGR